MFHAIGLIELNSIAKGIEAADAMMKTADVGLIVSKSICPGKYIAMVSGDVSAVNQSVERGKEVAGSVLVDSFVIPNISQSIMPAISGVTPISKVEAVGVIETFSVATAIESCDAAIKAATVTPIRLHLAFGIGGKCYYVLTGDVADVKTAVDAGVNIASERGLLVQYTVIPRPNEELIKTLI